MTTREECQGFEHDWLAVDIDGHVALLTTAGGGYVPEVYLQDVGAYDEAIEGILSTPRTTVALCREELPPELTDTWKLVAERGVFAFDSDYSGGPYKVSAAPHQPVALEDLPESVQRVAGRVVLSTICFRAADEVTEADIKASEAKP